MKSKKETQRRCSIIIHGIHKGEKMCDLAYFDSDSPPFQLYHKVQKRVVKFVGCSRGRRRSDLCCLRETLTRHPHTSVLVALSWNADQSQSNPLV